MDKIKEYENLLEAFDKLSLDNTANRRMAAKPLYDFFQRILRDVGIKCGLDENTIKNTHLSVRWIQVKSCLECIENPDKWDELIKRIQKIRSKIEHNDYHDPDRSNLIEIREQLPEFAKWVIHVSYEYYKKSTHFTFKESFHYNLNLNINKAEGILEEYCQNSSKKPPIDFSDDYDDLRQLTIESAKRLKEISNLEDIQKFDLENLMKISQIIAKFETKEHVLLELGICPDCGAKIKTTQEPIGSSGDSEPYGFYYRVGCQDCGYLLHEEYIDI